MNDDKELSSVSNITEIQYSALQKAYTFFNKRLFDGKLVDVLIIFNRKRHVAGYFCRNSFMLRKNEQALHEISLNPDTFIKERTVERILSTLVHEQAHLWQYQYGKRKSRNGYHNREWADKMEEIGLMPSTTGAEGGSRTGQSCSHYIIEEGPFYWDCADFLMCTDALLFLSLPVFTVRTDSKKKNKIAYRCPSCGQKAWAKPHARLMCGNCEEVMNQED